MLPESTSTIESPAHGLRVTIEDHGEHHMGCRTIVFVPDRPLGGVSRFQTTNGVAFFTPDGNGLFLHDACVILFVDLGTESVFHREAADEQLYANVRVEGDSLAYEVSDGRGNRTPADPFPLADVASVFEPGLGRVEDGRFPSAYPSSAPR